MNSLWFSLTRANIIKKRTTKQNTQQKNTYRSDNNNTKKPYTIITNVKTSQLQPRTYTSYISCVKKNKYIL